MARTFEYAVLTAVPNERRGERVNVGLVVFRDDRVDVRFKQAGYKLRAITGESWESRLDAAAQSLSAIFGDAKEAKASLVEFDMLEPLLKASNLGWMSADNEDEYEKNIEDILKSLVGLPRRERV